MGLVTSRQELVRRKRAITGYVRERLKKEAEERGKLARIARTIGFDPSTLSNLLAERSDGSEELVTALAEQHWGETREKLLKDAIAWLDAREPRRSKVRKAS